MRMSDSQYYRYGRHLVLPEIGVAGQEKLLDAKVVLIGNGGLGSPCAMYLAAAGVGTIGLMDFDVVDISNLQRQVLYQTDQVGKPKAAMAAHRLKALNPDTRVVTYEEALTSQNAMDIFADYDIVVDCTDNFATRYLVNDACVLSGKPDVYGSVFRFDGQATVFGMPDGPCYRCLFPVPPQPGEVVTCSEGGVFGVLPGLIGVVQATEVVKLITGMGEGLVNRLLLLDATSMRWREINVERNPDCPICGQHRTIHELMDYRSFCGMKPNGASVASISAASLLERMNNGWDGVVVDVREPFERDRDGFIGGSRLIPVNELVDRFHELEDARGREIVVYCQNGVCSINGAKILQTRGFEVALLDKGFGDWLAVTTP
ncbi:MAG: molybdopterin-synthase adenylyltransferase MoeB [Acidihalobacter sp.]|uniref:molybdopterin-synthase adenylyltransferase MoeB n=1 Tax=Acidihalobacter sp. TaxID=1872108 RepID=UPI00307F1361